MVVIIPLILLLSNAVYADDPTASPVNGTTVGSEASPSKGPATPRIPDIGYGSKWNYQINSAIGPDRWASNYPYCGGKSQSPINILTKHVIYNKNLGTLKLENYNQTADNMYFHMLNSNFSLLFDASTAKSGVIRPAIVFKGTTYRLHGFSFSWRSEHLVDSQRYAGEMTIFHLHSNLTQYKLVAWSHFLKVKSRDLVTSIEFQQLLDNFKYAKECCKKTKLQLNLFKLLPKTHNKFYHYNGSSTFPVCYGPVTWIVNKDPILVSENQMKLFHQLKDNAMGGIPIVDHFRPAQPLNTRKVESNFDLPQDDDDGNGNTGAGVAITSCSLPILTIVATLIFVF